jgi:hypothetical protein
MGMSETVVTLIVTVISVLGAAITALVGWLTKKGVNFLDKKTSVLDAESEIQRKEAIKNKIVDTVTLVARSTMQTYVDEVKARKADGKLTRDEASEAFRRTFDQSFDLLKREGIDVGKDVLGVVIEGVVGKLKAEKKVAA